MSKIDCYYDLLGAVIRNAVTDLSKNRIDKQYDSYEFLFEDNRLEDFITSWHLPLKAKYIRKKANEIILEARDEVFTENTN